MATKTRRTPTPAAPLNPLILAPNAKVDFFVTFPLDAKLWAIIQGDSILLDRMRSEVLSDTWFGDQIAGQLAYSLKSRARRERPSESPESRARAICKIKIFNQSKEQLNCQKFCLRLEHCHLWISGSELWTSPIQIRFNGSEHLSSIDYSGIVTVAIEFAAQTSLSNLISGLFLLGERPFEVGDLILVGTTRGTVISIDL